MNRDIRYRQVGEIGEPAGCVSGLCRIFEMQTPVRLIGVLIFSLLLFTQSVFSDQVSNATYAVDLSTLSTPKATPPKGLATHVFLLANRGSVEDTYTLDLTCSAGWEVVADLAPITLAPGEEMPIFVTLSIPAIAAAGEYHLVLRANSQGDPQVSAEATALVSVTAVFAVRVEVPTLEPARAGSDTTYRFTVINLGNTTDTFEVSVSALHKWEIVLSEEKITLGPGERAELTATLRAPEEVVKQTKDYLHFRAASRKAEASKHVLIEVLPRPREEVGTIYKEVPGQLSWKTIASGDIETEVGISVAGTLEGADWFALDLGISNVITFEPPNLFAILAEIITWNPTLNRFDYGSSWGTLSLGNVSMTLSSLSRKVNGRGGMLLLSQDPLSLNLYLAQGTLGTDIAWNIVKEKNLTSTIGFGSLVNMTESWGDLGIMHSVGYKTTLDDSLHLDGTATSKIGLLKGVDVSNVWVDFLGGGGMGDGEGNTVAVSYDYDNESIFHLWGDGVARLKAGQTLGLWTVAEKLGLSHSESTYDTSFSLDTLLDLTDFSLAAGYQWIGPDFLGDDKDKKGVYLKVHALPIPKQLSVSANCQIYHDNLLNLDPDSLTTTTAMLCFGFGLRLSGLPTLNGSFSWSGDKTLGESPEDESLKSEGSIGVGIYDYLPPIRYSMAGEWGRLIDTEEGTQVDFARYRASVYGRTERSFVWAGIAAGTRYLEEGESFLGGGIGMRYRLTPKLWGMICLEGDESGSTLSFGLSYRIATATTFSINWKRHDISRVGASQTIELSFDRGLDFNVPLPWIKVKGIIEGVVFEDENGNGVHDSGEVGVGDVILWANDFQTITAKDGVFRFPALEPGDYKLWLVRLPPGLVCNLPLPRRFSLEAGETTTLDIPLSKPGKIHVLVFNDENENGKKDPEEGGLAYVEVSLVSATFPTQGQSTASDGSFTFAKLVPGEYTARLDTRTLPSAFHLTTPQELAIVLSPDEEIAIEFGAYRKVVIERMPPTAEFFWDPEEPTAQDEIQLEDWSMVVEGEIVNWEWSFGDGATSTKQNPTHIYSEPGTYKVTLTVTDDAGLTDVITYEIVVSD